MGNAPHSASPFAKIIPFLLLASMLATCLGPEDDGLTIPNPIIGSVYNYRGSDGSWLNLTVGETNERKDALLRQHESLVVEIEFKSANPMVPAFHFQEAIEPNKGLLVHQLAHCGETLTENHTPVGCKQGRSIVYAGATGIPGGLGAGPFWGEKITTGHVNVNLKSPILSDWGLSGVTSSAEESFHSRSCTTVEYALPSDSIVWGHHDPELEWGEVENDPYYPALLLTPLFFTPIHGPFTFCEGFAFPVSFSPELGMRRIMDHDVIYSLDSWNGGDGVPIDETGNHVWDQKGDPLQEGAWEERIAVDNMDDTRLSSNAAHDYAMSNDDDYRRLIESGAYVVRNTYSDHTGSWYMDAVGGQESVARSMVVLHPEGEVMTLIVTRSMNIVLGEEIPGTIQIEGKDLDQIDLPMGFVLETLLTDGTRDQAGIQSAIDRGLQLTSPEDGYLAQASFTTSGVPWTGDHPQMGAMPPVRHEGFTLNTWWDPPGAAESSVVLMMEASFDGPSGAILHFGLPRDELPFE